MKNILIPVLFYFSIPAFSQTKTAPIKILYNANWEVITSGTPYYTGKAWKEGDKWHKQDFYYPAEKLQMDGIYADNDFKIPDGKFTWHHENGKISRSCLYVNGKREGQEFLFYENGNKASVSNFKDGLPVDTSVSWHENGQVSATIIADKEGNGTQSEYHSNGKLKTSGSVRSGKREGKWLCYDSLGAKLMMVQFQADSLTATTCVDANGNPIGGFCIYERVAEFRGGVDGWKRFLEQNLQYPNYAQRKNITGVVRVQFMVSKTGEVSDVAILSSPHESLSKEVLRLMSLSPKWSPAIQLNKPVMYRHIQTVTFRLE